MNCFFCHFRLLVDRRATLLSVHYSAIHLCEQLEHVCVIQKFATDQTKMDSGMISDVSLNRTLLQILLACSQEG